METHNSDSDSRQELKRYWALKERHRRRAWTANAIAIAEAVAILLLLIELYRKM